MVGDQCHYIICHALLERKGLKKHIHSGKWNKNLKIAPPTVRDFSQMFIIRDKEKPLRFSVSCLVLFWGLGKENCKIIQNTCSQYIQCPVNKHLRFDLTESLKSISRLIWFFFNSEKEPRYELGSFNKAFQFVWRANINKYVAY